MLCTCANAACALGDPNPHIWGRSTPRSPAGGWSWGSAPHGCGSQPLDHSWCWSYQHRGCQAELRLCILVQDHHVVSKVYRAWHTTVPWPLMAHPPVGSLASTHTWILVEAILIAPSCLFQHLGQVSFSSPRREFTYWHKCYLHHSEVLLVVTNVSKRLERSGFITTFSNTIRLMWWKSLKGCTHESRPPCGEQCWGKFDHKDPVNFHMLLNSPVVLEEPFARAQHLFWLRRMVVNVTS